MKKVMVVAVMVMVVVGSLLLVRRAQREAARVQAIQEVRDEITKFDRATEDHRVAHRSQVESCRLQDKLFDSRERLVRLTQGPLAESRLKVKNFGDRCAYDMIESLDRAWETVNNIDRRDLEDKLAQLERAGK